MSSSLATDFGPNDWFVQEKYEEFLADPQSVETIWRDFFAQTATTADHPARRPGHSATCPRSAGAADTVTAAAAARGVRERESTADHS